MEVSTIYCFITKCTNIAALSVQQNNNSACELDCDDLCEVDIDLGRSDQLAWLLI